MAEFVPEREMQLYTNRGKVRERVFNKISDDGKGRTDQMRPTAGAFHRPRQARQPAQMFSFQLLQQKNVGTALRAGGQLAHQAFYRRDAANTL